jgi:hypothetical protein
MTAQATTGAVFLFLMTFGCVAAANAQQGPSQVDGQWVMTTDVFGNALHQTLTLNGLPQPTSSPRPRRRKSWARQSSTGSPRSPIVMREWLRRSERSDWRG